MHSVQFELLAYMYYHPHLSNHLPLPCNVVRILLLKCLRRVLLLGFGTDAKLIGTSTSEVAACLPAMAQTLQQLLSAREVREQKERCAIV